MNYFFYNIDIHNLMIFIIVYLNNIHNVNNRYTIIIGKIIPVAEQNTIHEKIAQVWFRSFVLPKLCRFGA